MKKAKWLGLLGLLISGWAHAEDKTAKIPDLAGEKMVEQSTYVHLTYTAACAGSKPNTEVFHTATVETRGQWVWISYQQSGNVLPKKIVLVPIACIQRMEFLSP